MDDAHTNNAAPPPDPSGSHGEHAHIEPEGATPGKTADEMLAHGLLSYLHQDTPAVQRQRVDALVQAIHDEHAVPVHRLRFPIRTARGWMALAAGIALVGMMIFVGFPGETSAQAVVERSIETMRASGERRYEVRLVPPFGRDELPADPTAVVDTRSPNFMLLRGKGPQGQDVIAGRDAKGDWVIRPDGVVDREHFRESTGAWPRWAIIGDETLFADSIDRLLEEIAKAYDLSKASEATLEGHGDTKYRHITGTKKKIRTPGGDTIELWIDPATSVVERLEMRWNQRDGDGGPGAGPRGMPDAGGPGGPDRMDGQRPRRGPGIGGPGPRGPRPPGGDGERPLRPREDTGGPDHPRHGPPPEDLDGPMGPDGGPDGPGPDDGPGPGRRHGPPPPPPRPGEFGPGGPPDRGPNGGRPHDGPGIGPDGPGPGGPPPDRRGPPKRLVIQRATAPANGFDPSWFSPEAHDSKRDK